MAKLLSGKEVAASLNENIRERAEALRARGITPKLAIVRCGENSSDLSYERGAVKRAETCGIKIEKIQKKKVLNKIFLHINALTVVQKS